MLVWDRRTATDLARLAGAVVGVAPAPLPEIRCCRAHREVEQRQQDVEGPVPVEPAQVLRPQPVELEDQGRGQCPCPAHHHHLG
jgi:hypothetical protein